MLSNQSRKLLLWLKKEESWMTEQEVRDSCKHFREISFQAIKEKKYVKEKPDTDDIWRKQYIISDAGKAYLEGVNRSRTVNAREWLSFGLSVAAIAISIIALLMQEGIL